MLSFRFLRFEFPRRSMLPLYQILTASSISQSPSVRLASAQPLSRAVNVKFHMDWLTGSASLQEAGLECNRRWRRREGPAGVL